jgi:hypothetical protein
VVDGFDPVPAPQPAARIAAPPPGVRSRDFGWGVTIDIGRARIVSPDRLAKIIERLKDLGVEYVRLEIPMNLAMDFAANPNNPVRKSIESILKAGIDVVPILGVGSKDVLPAGLTVDSPDYVHRLATHVREVVRTLTPLGVSQFQIENELNAAGMATMPPYGWRSGARWWDPDFKVELLSALRWAVKVENPDATVYSNFHDQVSDPIPAIPQLASGQLDALNLPVQTASMLAGGLLRGTFLDEALKRFAPHLDRIGLDFYPNYVLPRSITAPLGLPAEFSGADTLGTRAPGEKLKQRVKHYQELTGKPVVIAESGYPSSSPLRHDASEQARFAEEMTAAARDSGAVGFTYFRLSDPPRPASGVGPNESVEPFFGLLDHDLQPKRGTWEEMKWQSFGPISIPVGFERREGSAWEMLKKAIAAAP